MKPKTLSLVTLSFLFVAMLGLMVLAGCGGSSSGNSTTTGTPAIGLSPTSLTFSSSVGVASAAQTVTITDSGTADLTFTGFSILPSSFAETNTCGSAIAAGGSCTVSVTYTPASTTTVSGTLTITDNASGSPQTVSLSGTGSGASVSPSTLTFSGVAVGSTSAPQSVTLTNAGTSALAISSFTITAGSPIFYLAPLPSPTPSNYCGTSVAANSTCVIYGVTFAPTAIGTFNGTLTIVDGDGTQTVALTGSTTLANTASVSVNFGPEGYQGADSYFNGIFTTITVCSPGSTTNCTSIPNVLVDTGSVGLRLLGTGASGVTTQVNSLNLPQITDPTTSYPLYECVQFGDLSYAWGAMQMASVQIGGETAVTTPGGTANAGIPIQVIGTGTPPVDVSYEGAEYANPCLVYPGTSTPTGGADDDTVASLGANGILGVGLFPQDCGVGCTSISTVSGEYLAYLSSTGATYVEPTALTAQAWNPVAAFSSSDTNGVMLNLPSIPSTGQATATGTLYFGIGTQSNNQITTQTYYEVDCEGDFLQASYNGVNYQDVNNQSDCSPITWSFIDSGSNGLFILDAGTLNSATGVTVDNCSDNGYYCPASPLNLSITLTDDNGTSVSGNGDISIYNADTLFSGNENAAFSNLGGASCVSTAEATCSASTDMFDFGLPFFFGRTIFVGIYGTSTTYPNGYWAF